MTLKELLIKREEVINKKIDVDKKVEKVFPKKVHNKIVKDTQNEVKKLFK